LTVEVGLKTFNSQIGTELVRQLTVFPEKLKQTGTFWLFGVMTTPARYLAIKIIPETKYKTLKKLKDTG